MSKQVLNWHRVADLDDLPSDRVKTVMAGVHSINEIFNLAIHADGDCFVHVFQARVI